jgi:hypothetical protein
MYTTDDIYLANSKIDESKKVLGILYRAMKPLLENFNPELTTIYDECLKKIPNCQYLQSAGELKIQYGFPISRAVANSTSDTEIRNLMIEHDVYTLPSAKLNIVTDPNRI